MKWHRYPLIRILAAFIIGIVVALCFPDTPIIPYWLLLLPFVGCLGVIFYRKIEFQYRFNQIFGILIFIFFSLFGWQYTIKRAHFIDQGYFSQIPDVVAYNGYIKEEPSEKARSWKSIIQVQYVRNDTAWIPAHGKILCYFSKDSACTFLRNGSNILFYAKPDSIPPALNPYSFDYRSYMQRREIAFRVYLTPEKWKIVHGNPPFSLMRVALNVRSKLLSILEKSHLTASEFGVASAILLGYDDKLDPEQRMLYSNAGAAHILCVSGMHVGVIFMIFSYLFSFLTKSKKGRRIRCIILLLLVWSYAFITGLAPAVSRASFMISFMILAQMLGRKNNTWNAIISSALILLIINPFLLIDVGFQLSYSAVIAIIALQRPLYNLVQVPTWLGDSIWSLISVSLVAQIGTMPIAMFYFHQFSNWFLLTNLIVIPLSTLIIYTGTALLCFSAVSFLKAGIGWLLFWEIKTLNFLMEWINNLPHAIISSINMSMLEMFLLLFFIIFGSIFLLQQRKQSLFVALGCLLMLCLSITMERIQHNRQEEFVVFEAGKSPVMGFVHGREMTVITDSAFLQNNTNQSFVINSYVVRKGIKNLDFETKHNDFQYFKNTGLYRMKDAYVFHDDKIFVANGAVNFTGDVLNTDYLIIRNTYYGNPKDVLESFQTPLVIIDGSNSLKIQQQWNLLQDSLPSQLYLLPVRGAMVKNYDD